MKTLRPIARLAAVVLMVAAAPLAGAVDLKIATVAPDGTLWMKEMRKAADDILKRTEGRVTFKFYPGGTMGSDRSVLRKIRAGQLHGGALTGGALADVYPDAQLYSLPLLFRSDAELDYVRARMDPIIAEGLEKAGFVTFGFSYGGFAYVMASSPIRQVDDLKSQKVWVPEGDDIARTLFETLGVSPVPLPVTDVLTGLQTGLITTVATSPVGAIALQWHTRVKYVTDTPAVYVYGSLAIDKKAFSRLTPGDQKIVREVMAPTFENIDRQNRLDDRNARIALEKQGIVFLKLPDPEIVKLRKAAGEAIESLGKRNAFTVARLRTLQSYLDTFRRNASVGATR